MQIHDHSLQQEPLFEAGFNHKCGFALAWSFAKGVARIYHERKFHNERKNLSHLPIGSCILEDDRRPRVEGQLIMIKKPLDPK